MRAFLVDNPVVSEKPAYGLGPMMKQCALLIAVILSIPLTACSSNKQPVPSINDSTQFGYLKYRPYSLQEAIVDHAFSRVRGDIQKEGVSSKKTIGITTAEFKYRIRVNYTGEIRPISSDARLAIESWANALGHEGSPRAFIHEILVLEDSKKYWLPIQEVLLPPLRQEASVGQPINLYVMWIGHVDRRQVFIANEFDARSS